MSPQQNPYGFITGDQPPQKKSVLNAVSTKSKFVFLGAILAVIIILVLILASLFSGGDETSTALRATQQRQTEIARISSLTQVTQNGSRSIKNLSANIQLTVSSDKNKLTAAIGKRGIKFKSKDLAVTTSGATTEKIETALAAGTLSPTILDIYRAELTAYRESLQAAYNISSSKEVRDTLRANYANTELLVQQLEATQ